MALQIYDVSLSDLAMKLGKVDTGGIEMAESETEKVAAIAESERERTVMMDKEELITEEKRRW